ncbi:MAG: PP2C family protein-serine/threonine phosphatase, partial [Nocardioides sp.]
LVDENPTLAGTSTTATVALFDGETLAMGHVGDSRAYLLRDGELRQLTADHTFVQTLIDDGQITEDEARTHPHRNLILKAIDGIHDLEPDLFVVEISPGDRLLFCSDGASGVLDNPRLADILRSGNADFAAVELVRASLAAGSTDNVTCLVADIVEGELDTSVETMLVGAAAELPRKARGSGVSGLFRGHRSGDTGELEPVQAEIPDDIGFAIPSDPIDPEEARYAPRAPHRFAWVRRFLALLVLVGLIWAGGAAAWSWTQHQYYVGEHDGVVTIFRGVNADLPGVELSTPYETTDLAMDSLTQYDRGQVEEGIGAGDLAAARRTVDNLVAEDPGSAGT